MVPLVRGQHIGDYEVGLPAGAPESDSCFRATQLSTGREVRIKILAHAARINGDGESIEAARRMAHPNVASLFDVAAENALLYAATEWVEGETLRQKLAKGRLPARRAAAYAAQIASGLAAAHGAGVVHGDLKPENIRITKEGQVKIVDFGLANLSDTEDETVRFADYASPEQVRGEPETSASDIFSLGVMLHEMLSGTRPFLRSTLAATTTAILKGDPPRELPPGVTPALARIVRHCLEKLPEERFGSASDLAFALESFWNLTLPHDKVRKLYRKHFTGLFLACVLGAVMGAAMGALMARRYLRPVAAAPLSFRYLTGSGHDSAPSASADGKTIVYSSDRDGVSRIWTMQRESGQETALTGGPDRFPRLSPDGTTVLFVRQEAAGDNLYTIPAAGGTARKTIADVQSADWTPAGGIVWLRVARNALAYTSTLGIATGTGQQPVEIAHVDKQVLAHPRCSPDGTLVAAVAGPSEGVHVSVFVARAAGGGQPYILAPPANGGDISALTWAPGSANVIYFQSENRAGAGGAHVVRQNAKTGGAAVIGFSQQNARLVDRLGPDRLLADSGSMRENLEEITVGRDALEPRPLTLGDIADHDPVYARGNESIFFSSFRGGELGVWEVVRKTGATRRVIAGRSNETEPFPFSDGKRILWTSDREGHFEIYWAAIANPHPSPITHDSVDAEHASITPDDAWVVYNSGNPARKGVWKIRPTGVDDLLLAAGETRWPEVSPDGKYVLYTVDRGTLRRAVQVVTLEDGKRIGPEIVLELRRGSEASSVGRAQWMPGGRAIAYIGQDDRGRSGVFVQDFPTGTRRVLGGFSGTRTTESFAVSSDGVNLTMAAQDQSTGIVEISNVPGAARR
jgi:Tol biopolymer transport system component